MAVVDVVDVVDVVSVGGVAPGPSGSDHPDIATYGPVPCADTDLVVGAGIDGQFGRLGAAVGPVPSQTRALTGAYAEVLGARTAAARVPVPAAAAGVPCAPVQNLAAVQHDPQVVAIGLLQRVAHLAGEVTVVGSSCPTG